MKLSRKVIRREFTLFHADTHTIDETKSCLFNCLARLPYNSQPHALYSYTHEPTKKVTKVGALLFGQVTSLIPFSHSCLRDSSLDCYSGKIDT
jgi:hypothetical protein